MLTETSPEQWADLRRGWFGSLYEIANLDLQRSFWLAPPTASVHWSYVEFCCSFPDRCQLQFAVDEGHMTELEFSLLCAVEDAISNHNPPGDDPYNYHAILSDPAWHSVVAKAERTRQQLVALTTDPNERGALLGNGEFMVSTPSSAPAVPTSD